MRFIIPAPPGAHAALRRAALEAMTGEKDTERGIAAEELPDFEGKHRSLEKQAEPYERPLVIDAGNLPEEHYKVCVSDLVEVWYEDGHLVYDSTDFGDEVLREITRRGEL